MNGISGIIGMVPTFYGGCMELGFWGLRLSGSTESMMARHPIQKPIIGTCSNCSHKKVPVVKFKGVQLCVEDCLITALQRHPDSSQLPLPAGIPPLDTTCPHGTDPNAVYCEKCVEFSPPAPEGTVTETVEQGDDRV